MKKAEPHYYPAHLYLYLPILAPEKEATEEHIGGALRNSIKGKPKPSSGECFC